VALGVGRGVGVGRVRNMCCVTSAVERIRGEKQTKKIDAKKKVSVLNIKTRKMTRTQISSRLDILRPLRQFKIVSQHQMIRNAVNDKT